MFLGACSKGLEPEQFQDCILAQAACCDEIAHVDAPVFHIMTRGRGTARSAIVGKQPAGLGVPTDALWTLSWILRDHEAKSLPSMRPLRTCQTNVFMSAWLHT